MVHRLGLTKFQMTGWDLGTRKDVESTRSNQCVDKAGVESAMIQAYEMVPQ